MLVEDATTLTDGTREVKLYHAPNIHTSGMLAGYVPDARVLFTADLVSDTFPLVSSARLVGPYANPRKTAFGRDDRVWARQRHALCSACLCAREISGHERATPIPKQVR